MKKTLSFILALVMLLGCISVTAFAEEPTKVVWDESEISDISCFKGADGEMHIDNNTLKGITVECVPYTEGTGWYYTLLNLLVGGTVTFTSTVGAISKIEISAENVSCEDYVIRFCPGWSLNGSKLTWQGEPAETVTLTTNYNLIVTGMSQIVFTIGEENSEEDTFLTSFTLNKDYIDTYDHSKHVLGVNETLKFDIEPITENAPQFAGDTIILNVKDGKGSTKYPLPAVTDVGEYWYAITERANDTAGVHYNSDTFYLHLVTDCRNGEYGVISAQLHTTAPADDGTYKNDDKITSILNFYAMGMLNITQDTLVNGVHNSDDTFTATVTFILAGSNPASTIQYRRGPEADIYYIYPDDWKDGSVSVDIELKDGETVSFTGIPDSTTYTVKQKTDAQAMGYDTATFSLDNPDESGDCVYDDCVVCMIHDPSDTVTIHNEKGIPIDVGVMLENGAFIVLGLGALALGAWLVLSKRKERAYDAE